MLATETAGRHRLLLFIRSGGTWSAPELVDEALMIRIGALQRPARAAVDATGRLHILWWRTDSGWVPNDFGVKDLTLHYRSRAGGQWSEAGWIRYWFKADDEYCLDATTDAQGRPHFAFYDSNGIFWPMRGKTQIGLASPENSSWPSQKVDIGLYCPAVNFAVSNADALVMAYSTAENNNDFGWRAHRIWTVQYRDGSWSERVLAHVLEPGGSNGPGPTYPQIAIDKSGRQHLVWAQGHQWNPSRLRHSTSTDGVTWSAPIEIVPPDSTRTIGRSPQLLIDSQDRLHLFYTRSGGVAYTRFENGLWSESVPVPMLASSGLGLTMIGGSTIHAVWGNGYVYHASLDVSD